MANILALDTSTDACSVALQIGEARSEIFRVIPRRHTHELLPMVEEILAAAQLKVQQLDAIAFGRGPGSFAGIRIATGVAQGLAFAADLPVVPVSSLAALAQGYLRENSLCEHQVVSALDARMDEVYWGVYQLDSGIAELVIPEVVSKPCEVNFDFETSYVGAGSGFNYQAQMPEQLTTRLNQISCDVHPHSVDILAIADQQFKLGNYVTAQEAHPVYLRNQVAWKKKDQQ